MASATDLQKTALRWGILGTARINRAALVSPAQLAGHRLVAIASRDRFRAEAFAQLNAVEIVLDSYSDVLNVAEVDAIYNPLPNGLHGPWNIKAIAAGKHVLSEKPFASNAQEAAAVAMAAQQGNQVVMEAFHYFYHPVAMRMRALLASGELGKLQRVETTFNIPAPSPSDLRWSLPLAGGATMDLGCYCLHAQRTLAEWAEGEPTVVSSRAGLRAGCEEVDEWMEAELEFPSGASGALRCHMAAAGRRALFRIIGTRGVATAVEFVEPHLDDRIFVRTSTDERIERLGTRPTYSYQLDVFENAIRNCSAVPTGVEDAVANMRLIDQCYEAAGLHPRPRSMALG
ncbi:Gfo/Idh/MocA family protein [Mycolicibacterium neoaurum]|uniref:Gfo/Idh/MocA family protein n=1 Tax=Mycolicibacterium neoaurum TaxID=1795 RepID=UPI001F4CB324|nr:Gfo/Idh/MocA family oxidoreductase [Mycolicibacterium neoaurum]